MRQDTSLRYDTDLSATGVNNRGRGMGEGALFQTSPNKWRGRCSWVWAAMIWICSNNLSFKGHFLCYWLAVVHTWQLSSPGEAVSRGTRPTWNAHTGEEIGLETNTEDAAARWGNWKIQKGRGNEETRPLTPFILKSCFLIRTQLVRYGPNNTRNDCILSGCVRTHCLVFMGKYCDLEKSMLYREGGQVDTITLTYPQVSILALLLLRYRTELGWMRPNAETAENIQSVKRSEELFHHWNSDCFCGTTGTF